MAGSGVSGIKKGRVLNNNNNNNNNKNTTVYVFTCCSQHHEEIWNLEAFFLLATEIDGQQAYA
jgi:hypothetical protein